MLVFYLLSLQFALVFGSDFMCMYIETIRCHMPVAHMEHPNYCSLHEHVMACMVKEAKRCHVENTTEFRDMQNMVREVCYEGTDLNREFSVHSACQSRALKAASSAPCLREFRLATVREIQSLRGPYLLEFKHSDDAKAELMGELSCGFMSSILQCSKETMNRTCGPAATEFFQRIKTPKEHFMKLACVDEDDYQQQVSSSPPTQFLSRTVVVLAQILVVLNMRLGLV